MSLTLHFVPYHEIEDLGSARRVKKLIDIVKENKIVLLEGKLTDQEAKDLIEITMEEISAKFKGIELETINMDKKNQSLIGKIRTNFINKLLGNRKGFTIIGPATIVKEIKRDPNKIELFTKEVKNKKKK